MMKGLQMAKSSTAVLDPRDDGASEWQPIFGDLPEIVGYRQRPRPPADSVGTAEPKTRHVLKGLTVEEVPVPEIKDSPIVRVVEVGVLDGNDVVFDGRPLKSQGRHALEIRTPEQEVELKQRIDQRRLTIVEPVPVQLLTDCLVGSTVRCRGETVEVAPEKAAEMSATVDMKGCRKPATAIVLAGRPRFPVEKLPRDPKAKASPADYRSEPVAPAPPLHIRTRTWLLVKGDGKEGSRNMTPPGTDAFTTDYEWAALQRDLGTIEIRDPVAQ